MYSGAGVRSHGVAYLQQQEKCSAQHKHMGDPIPAAEQGYKVGAVASGNQMQAGKNAFTW